MHRYKKCFGMNAIEFTGEDASNFAMSMQKKGGLGSIGDYLVGSSLKLKH